MDGRKACAQLTLGLRGWQVLLTRDVVEKSCAYARLTPNPPHAYAREVARWVERTYAGAYAELTPTFRAAVLSEFQEIPVYLFPAQNYMYSCMHACMHACMYVCM